MRALATSVLLATTLLFGCGSDDPEPAPGPSPAAPGGGRAGPPADPPTIRSIEIPTFPPLGPTSRVAVVVDARDGWATLSATFKNRVDTFATASSRGSRAELRARDLGEGQGTLVLEVCDVRNACSARAVEDLIVDLSPPEIEPERLVASPRVSGVPGQIAFWVADDWVLGDVRLEAAGKVLTRELPKAYPSTLGKAWDVSRIAFDASLLGESKGLASLIVRDAAGNELRRSFEIVVDGTPPTASISSPAEGARITGDTFAVRAAAVDVGGTATPPTLELWIGGARVAELPGPAIDVDVDTTTLPPGPVEVRVIARDEAGNESEPIVRTITH